jgi:hypothetical protein
MQKLAVEIDADRARKNFVNRCTKGLWSEATGELVGMMTTLTNGYAADGDGPCFNDNDIQTLQWLLSIIGSCPEWRLEVMRIFNEASIPVNVSGLSK